MPSLKIPFQPISMILLLILLLSARHVYSIENYLPEGLSSAIIHVEYRRDQSKILTIEDVRQPKLDSPWSTLTEDYANFGYQPVDY